MITFKRLLMLFFVVTFLMQGVVGHSAEKEEYKLQSSDVLNVTVHNQPDLTTKTRVSADGYISFPLIGKLAAKDLTVRELEQRIATLLEKDYLVKAEVLVFIEEYHPRQVSVIGEVEKPGKYDMPIEKKMTLLEAIAMAGGFTKRANITNTTIIRSQDGLTERIKIRAKDILNEAQSEKDIVLEPNDIITVEYYPRQVSVIGEVEKPGKYDMLTDKDTTLLEAIAMAGGFTKHADVNGTKVIRMKDGERQTIKVRAKDLIDKGEKEINVVLEPDDVVTVPESFF